MSGTIVFCAEQWRFYPDAQSEDTTTQARVTNSDISDGEEPLGPETVASDGAGIPCHHCT